MRFHRILISVLVLCFIALAIKLFHSGNDIWIAFMLLSIVSSFLLINDRETHTIDPIMRNFLKYKSQPDYKIPKDWEDYKATYDDGVADGLEMDSETNYFNNAMRNRDAEIKYKTDEHNSLCGCNDCIPF